jgi:hypothetical protein
MLELFFAPIIGEESVALEASAIAFVEARDLVVVLDYSSSMNYDSQFRADSITKLGQAAIEANLQQIWEDLGSPTYGNMGFTPDWVTTTASHSNVTWKGTQAVVNTTQSYSQIRLTFTDGNTQTFNTSGTSGTFSGTGSHSGKLISQCRVTVGSTNNTHNFYDNNTIINGLGLSDVPYPYAGGNWGQYIEYARDHSSSMTSWYESQINAVGYRRKFGVMTLINFWLQHKEAFSQTWDLWKTRHYPHHALKEGASLLCDFLENLEFGDHLGLVTYDTYHRVESSLSSTHFPETVNLGDQLITDDYASIDTIQRHKQAGHYYSTTNIGGGLWDATTLLSTHGRYGARPTILLMTDGNANTSDSGWSWPSDWDWVAMTDYDGDGVANYTTSDNHKKYIFYRAKQAIDMGVTIHTLSVGANADRDLMRAIAYAGGGIWLDVPGGSTVAEMEAQMLEAFGQIAANVPPAKLLIDPDAE